MTPLRTCAPQLALLALTIGGLAACQGAAPGAPSTPNASIYDVGKSSLQPPPQAVSSSDGRSSWVAPEAKHKALMYVASGMTHNVNIYSYPQGKLEGKLTGFNFPNGLCSDPKGNVYVPDGVNEDVLEYIHGGSTPVATFPDPGQQASTCAVDPVTGTLAVGNVVSKYLNAGSISLYANASGNPEVLSLPTIQVVYQCGYDNKGNLFVDGLTGFYTSQGAVFALAELPKGQSSFKTISIDKKIALPGIVQWDGMNMAVGDAKNGTVYRTNGETGKVKSITKIANAALDFQPWIQGDTILVPGTFAIYLAFVPYPGGGKASKTLNVGSPSGVTVSLPAK